MRDSALASAMCCRSVRGDDACTGCAAGREFVAWVVFVSADEGGGSALGGGGDLGGCNGSDPEPHPVQTSARRNSEMNEERMNQRLCKKGVQEEDLFDQYKNESKPCATLPPRAAVDTKRAADLTL